MPFGGAVLDSLGVPEEEANAILEAKRKEVLNVEKELKETSEKESTTIVVEEERGENFAGSTEEEEHCDEGDEPFVGESREIGEFGEPLTKKDVIEGVLFDAAKVGKMFDLTPFNTMDKEEKEKEKEEKIEG